MEIKSTGNNPIPFGKQGEAPNPDQIYAYVFTQFSLIFSNFYTNAQSPSEYQPEIAALIKQLQQIPSSDPNYQKVQTLISDLQNISPQTAFTSFATAYADIMNFTRSQPGAMSIIASSPTMTAELAYGQIGYAYSLAWDQGNYPSQAQMNEAIQLLQNASQLLGPYLTPNISSEINQAISDMNAQGPDVAADDIWALINILAPELPSPDGAPKK